MTKYDVKGYAGPNHHAGVPVGTLLVHTWHIGESSKDIEVSIWVERIKTGDASKCEVLLKGKIIEVWDICGKHTLTH